MQTRLWSGASLTVLAAAGVVLAGAASAQAWKPERPVELTVPSGPGGSNDVAGRVIQKLFDDLKLLPVSCSVVYRAGGGVLDADDRPFGIEPRRRAGVGCHAIPITFTTTRFRRLPSNSA